MILKELEICLKLILKNIDSNSSKDLKSKIEKVKDIYDSIGIKELIKIQDNFQKLLGSTNSENIKEKIKGLVNSENIKGLGNSENIKGF